MYAIFSQEPCNREAFLEVKHQIDGITQLIRDDDSLSDAELNYLSAQLDVLNLKDAYAKLRSRSLRHADSAAPDGPGARRR
jgi:hypothetical protein